VRRNAAQRAQRRGAKEAGAHELAPGDSAPAKEPAVQCPRLLETAPVRHRAYATSPALSPALAPTEPTSPGIVGSPFCWPQVRRHARVARVGALREPARGIANGSCFRGKGSIT